MTAGRPHVLHVVQKLRQSERAQIVLRLKISDLIRYGASPRATIFLAMASRAHAMLQGRGYVIPQDVKDVGMDILRHRVIITYEAEAEEKTSEDIVKQIFDTVEVP